MVFPLSREKRPFGESFPHGFSTEPLDHNGTLGLRLFKFLKLNQRISAIIQGTPRRGNEHIAQGIALGRLAAAFAP